MRWKMSLLRGIFLTGGFVLAILSGPALAGFVYQDFEPDNGSETYGWSNNAQASLANASESRRYSGQRVWKVQASGQWSTTGIAAQRETWDTNFFPDRNDRLTFWIRAIPDAGWWVFGPKVTHNSVGVTFFDKDKYQQDGFEVWTASRATYQTWTPLHILFSQLPADFDLSRIDKIEFKNYWPGTYYYDDIRVELADRVYQSFDDPYMDQYGWVWNDADTASLSAEGEPVYSGMHSWKMVLKGNWGGGGFKSQEQKYTSSGDGAAESSFWHVDLSPERNERLTFWVYSLADNGLDNNVGVQFYDHEAHATDETKAVVWTKTKAVYGRWTQLSVGFEELPETLDLKNINKIQLQFYWPGTYYIDDLRATRVQPTIDEDQLRLGVLDWQPLPSAERYLVEESLWGPQGPWRLIADTEETIHNLNRLTKAWYRLAWREAASSEQPLVYTSAWADAIEFEPSTVFVSKQALAEGRVEWDEVSGATDYQVQEAALPQGPWHMIHDGPRPEAGLSAKAASWYRARAVRRVSTGIEQTSLWSRPQARDEVKGFLRVYEQDLRERNGAGEIVVLRGVNLGNLFLIEPEFAGIGGDFTNGSDETLDDDDFGIRTVLRERFGAENLLEVFQNHYLQEADLDRLVTMGANFVRLPISYEQIQDDDGGWTRFAQIDRVIQLCADRGLYVLFDLHGAPGRQSQELHSGRKDYNRLFENSEQGRQYREQTKALWTAIASRYRNNTTVAGYDLLNEPFGALDHDPSLSAPHGLWTLYDDLYTAVRAVDANHLIVMEMIPSEDDWSTLPDPKTRGWENVVYQVHYYGFRFNDEGEIDGILDPEEHARFIDDKIMNARDRAYGVPVLVGEFNGFNQRRNWEHALESFSERGWSWAIWTYKSHPALGEWGLLTHDRYGESPVNIMKDSREDLIHKFSRFQSAGYFSPNPSLQGILGFFFERPDDGFQVVINELMASNISTLADEDGDYSGWIEIKNMSGVPVNLQGFTFQDESASWSFGYEILDAWDYRVIWASGKNRAGDHLHTNFTMDPTGERILLRDSQGRLLDSVKSWAMADDESHGRFPDGGIWTAVSPPTPGTANQKAPSPEIFPELLSPVVDSVLEDTRVTFEWSPGLQVTEYYLGVGTSAAAVASRPWGDIFAGSTGTMTSREVTGIPLNGQPVDVRLWWLVKGVWSFKDYQYQTRDGRPMLVSPREGFVLDSSTVEFEWTSGAGVEEYYLGVGTTAVSVSRSPWGDLHHASAGLSTSQAVAGIPLKGQSVYVRLWWRVRGVWQFADDHFETINQPEVLPDMTAPVPGSTLTVTTVNFQWSSGSGITEYFLGVGTTAAAVSRFPWGDLFAGSTGLMTSREVSGIPLNGKTVYVRLWWKTGGIWKFRDYGFGTTIPVTVSPELVQPDAGIALESSTVLFEWSPGTGGIEEYYLGVGTTAGSVARFPWGDLHHASAGLATSGEVSGIPLTGQRIYVRLWWRIRGNWQWKDYTFETYVR